MKDSGESDFSSKLLSPIDSQQVKQNEKAWRYVGRFLWAFATIESAVNEIFVELFQLGAGAALLCIGSLDLRKKLKLIEAGLRDQGLEHHEGLLNQVHKLADIRNVIAHCSFGPDEMVAGEEGIDFDYVNRNGKVKIPLKEESGYLMDTTITYATLDSYDSEAAELFGALQNIQGSLTPIHEVKSELARDIAEIIGSSDNIIVFPTKPPTT